MKKKMYDPFVAQRIEELTPVLARLHPGCGRVPWFKILRAIHHETSGSEAGFELANHWSSRGQNYKGRKDVRMYWRSIEPGPRPITILSLIWMGRVMAMLYGKSE